ncbi:hypothetical protein WR25_22321 [Diploscapter pachys]|uniref:Uncharacterized protein n=1 Tax=Diploscapter pachys TaxID=2018661 RepID=A0A2A2L0U6_9BILA|nr:hypothetical protein WR25_22321 [Diploscapter pachys]
MDTEAGHSEAEKLEETSDTDSDFEFDPIEYERRRDNNLRQIVVAEAEFNHVKQCLKEVRLRELNERRQQIATECSKEFIKRSREIEQEKSSELAECESLYALSIDSLNRQKAAWLATTPHLEDDNLEDIQLKLLQIAEEEYTKAQNDSLQAQVGVLRFSNKCRISRNKPSNSSDFLMQHYKKHLRLPSVVEQISKEKMEEDLEYFAVLDECLCPGEVPMEQQQQAQGRQAENRAGTGNEVEYEESSLDDEDEEEKEQEDELLDLMVGREEIVDVTNERSMDEDSRNNSPDISKFQFDLSSPIIGSHPKAVKIQNQRELVK